MKTNVSSSLLLAVLDPEEIPAQSKIIVLFGDSAELHPLVLQLLFLRAARGEQVGVVIGDNRFDAYTLARLARSRGFNPLDLLRRIDFSRPFTCHQLHHCVLNQVEEKTASWSVLCILGLLDMLYDEDILYADATRLLNEILERLRQIAEEGVAVLVTISPPPKQATRTEFVTRMIGAADGYWQPAPLGFEQPTLQPALF